MTKSGMYIFIKIKIFLINANLVPLIFGANGAVLLAPASATASRVRPWRQMHAWFAILLGCSAWLHASAACRSA